MKTNIFLYILASCPHANNFRSLELIFKTPSEVQILFPSGCGKRSIRKTHITPSLPKFMHVYPKLSTHAQNIPLWFLTYHCHLIATCWPSKFGVVFDNTTFLFCLTEGKISVFKYIRVCSQNLVWALWLFVFHSS